MSDIIQSWAHKGRELYASVHSENDLRKLDELIVAEQCGYYFEQRGEKIVQLELFREEIDKATKEYNEWYGKLKLKTNKQIDDIVRDDRSDDTSRYFVINETVCCIDADHGGQVYVPRRCILADPDFYDINDWDEVTKDYLLNASGYSTEGLETPESPELLEIVIAEIEDLSEQFTERMMVKNLWCMCYVNVDEEYIDFVEDKDLIKWARIKPEDIHPISSWHDG